MLAIFKSLISIHVLFVGRGGVPPGAGSGRAGTSGGPFAALFGNPSTSRPSTAPVSSAQGSGQSPNFQNLLQTAMGAAAGGQQLTPEAVSRVMQDALSRLPPEQRASQLNALRGELRTNFACSAEKQLTIFPSPISLVLRF